MPSEYLEAPSGRHAGRGLMVRETSELCCARSMAGSRSRSRALYRVIAIHLVPMTATVGHRRVSRAWTASRRQAPSPGTNQILAADPEPSPLPHLSAGFARLI